MVVPGAEAERLPPGLAFQRVTVVRSAKHTQERLAHVGIMALGADGSGGAQKSSVFVCPSACVSKPFLGFGGSFTEASAVVFDQMSEEKQEEILRAYFDPDKGLGYRLGRISIASCDFGLGNWMCGDLQDGDMELRGFSIDHYKTLILPMLKRAEAVSGGPFVLLASPWSPPPWMKTNGRFNRGGHLRPECAASWAMHYAKFIKAMAEVGIEIWGVTVQNEPEASQPWESCIYTGKEEAAFVRDHLGPTLANEGLASVNIVIWDHNRDGMLERAADVYGDPEAAKYVWGVAYHWYGDARFETWPERSEVAFEDRQEDCAAIFELRSRCGFENVRRVAELCPQKHILFTEGCQELGGRSLSDVLWVWKLGERYGMNIINDLSSGTEGWIDWNLCLNENGGPNHVENHCVAPVICDTRTNEVSYPPAFWYIGHFSKFIRPGARRVVSSSSRDVLEVVSFVNPDGCLAVVVMNQSEDGVDFWLKIPGRAVEVEAPPRSITTFLLDDLDPDVVAPTSRRVAFETQHGTYLKVTDGSPSNGHLCQTSEAWSGWETFRLVQTPGEPFCCLRTFHKTWLSVTADGVVTTAPTAGERERFVLEARDNLFAVRTLHGSHYLSVGPGVGTELVTVTTSAGLSELFNLPETPGESSS